MASEVLQRLTNGLRRIFVRREDPLTREITDTLKQVPIFRGLSRRVIKDLAEVVHTRDYRSDEFIYYEKDPGLGMYVVRRGRVRLLVEDSAGAIHELRQVVDNDVFGKLSLLGDFRRVDTAQAITDTRVIGLFRPDLKTIIKQHPSAAAAILDVLARNLASTQSELIRVLVEKDGKVEAMRLIDGATARIDHISAETAV
ncbi:MAG: cyclic nucleotide-binding domain-containing protein [Rhodothermales bacterium]